MNMNRDYTFQMTMIKEAQKFKKPYAHTLSEKECSLMC